MLVAVGGPVGPGAHLLGDADVLHLQHRVGRAHQRQHVGNLLRALDVDHVLPPAHMLVHGQAGLIQQPFQGLAQALILRHPFEVIALLRACHRPAAQERPPQKGPAAALPGHGVPGRGAPQGDVPLLVLLHHVQGKQQRLGVLVAQGQHAAAPSAQAGVLHKMQPRRDAEPCAQKQEDSPGQGGVFHAVGHLYAAQTPQGQAPGGLGEGAELGQHAALLPQGQADQLVLGHG